MTDMEIPEGGGLFSGEPQHDVFPHLHHILPSTVMPAAADAYQFPEGPAFDLPATHDVLGTAMGTGAFLEETDTASLLVFKDGAIVHEHYALTGGRDVQWISWSVAKSFVSALLGIAIDEGHVRGIADAITDYVPGLAGSAYDGVSIENVLQMSSGAAWVEDYSDPSSDVHRLAAVTDGSMTLPEFMAGMQPEHEPGTVCRYNSADTQALGMLLIHATGRSIADYMHENLVVPLGMESDSHWITDNEGMEMAYGGLMMTPRDFAKLGELFRRGGDWFGRQVVPAEWVARSLVFDKPHLEPGRTVIGSEVLPTGYGYQWWLYPGEAHDFSAIGIYNQHVYVDPAAGVVIQKSSANRRYGLSTDEADNRSGQTYLLFRAIADALS